MDVKRFEALADAWGGDIARWPAAERDAARQFFESHEIEAGRALGAAAGLDALLSASVAVPPSFALRARVIRAAPHAPTLSKAAGRAWRWLVGAGIGGVLASACAAGLATGVAVAPTALARAGWINDGDPANEAARLLREPVDVSEG